MVSWYFWLWPGCGAQDVEPYLFACGLGPGTDKYTWRSAAIEVEAMASQKPPSPVVHRLDGAVPSRLGALAAPGLYPSELRRGCVSILFTSQAGINHSLWTGPACRPLMPPIVLQANPWKEMGWIASTPGSRAGLDPELLCKQHLTGCVAWEKVAQPSLGFCGNWQGLAPIPKNSSLCSTAIQGLSVTF